MAFAKRFDHIGITVNDLEEAQAFFVALGLEPEGDAQVVEGDFVNTVVGMDDVRTKIVMLQLPGATTKLELSTFLRSDQQRPAQALLPNEPGLRNVCFEVDDLQAAVDDAAARGYGLVGGIGEYEGVWKMAYIRGPEGIIVSLAEQIG